MKTIEKCAAQGDVFIRRVQSIPSGATEVKRDKAGRLVIAHSETGHHHAIETPDVRLFSSDALVGYLSVDGAFAELVHHRPYDAHEALSLPAGIWEIRRQREHTPEGWRRVED